MNEETAMDARGKRKMRVGRVVSTAMDKTAVIEVRQSAAHATYTKIVRHNTRLKAHDENNEANVGDTVRIVETRPLSKTKRWRIDEVLEKAK